MYTSLLGGVVFDAELYWRTGVHVTTQYVLAEYTTGMLSTI